MKEVGLVDQYTGRVHKVMTTDTLTTEILLNAGLCSRDKGAAPGL